MEIRVLFVHTNCFLQALCSHALNYNHSQLMSLQHLTAIWVPISPHLCPYLLFHSYSEQSCPIVRALSTVTEILRGHCGCDIHCRRFSTENKMIMIFFKVADIIIIYNCRGWFLTFVCSDTQISHYSFAASEEWLHSGLMNLVDKLYCGFWGVNIIWYTDAAIHHCQQKTGQCLNWNFKTAPSDFL